MTARGHRTATRGLGRMIFPVWRCGSRAGRHHGRVLSSVGLLPGRTAAGHAGFLVGRYRNGAFSDAWTDVSRCADGTFTGFAAACSCGWRGPLQPTGARGRLLCGRDWHAHLAPAGADGPPDGRHGRPFGGAADALPAVPAS